jgi:hypothetical protein
MLNLLKRLERDTKIKDYLFVFYGKLNQDIIVSAIQMIENKMIMEGFTKTAISKTKIVCIEILQNIIKHQTNHDQIFPYFIIGSSNHTLKILSGNVITQMDKDVIIKKLDNFIALNKEDIRDNYKFALKNNIITKEGNAGVGLLDIVYRSDNNVSYKIDKLPHNLFSFNINVSIN